MAMLRVYALNDQYDLQALGILHQKLFVIQKIICTLYQKLFAVFPMLSLALCILFLLLLIIRDLIINPKSRCLYGQSREGII